MLALAWATPDQLRGSDVLGLQNGSIPLGLGRMDGTGVKVGGCESPRPPTPTTRFNGRGTVVFIIIGWKSVELLGFRHLFLVTSSPQKQKACRSAAAPEPPYNLGYSAGYNVHHKQR